ncbi:MAG: minor capsid protein [Oenococcus sp.]|uniref:minor capsid protein n=1 Tax=Oenococcus sp. TaxID=1979414 RepID=UPI0039EC4801
MGVIIHTDFSKINRMFSDSSLKAAKRALANQIVMDSDKFVPLATKERYGNADGRSSLRANISVSADGNLITYNAPYAYYQYYHKLNFKPMSQRTAKQRRYFFANKAFLLAHKGFTTKGTSDHWFDKAKSQYTGRWLEVYKRGILHG